jgi:DNA-directed RNA polymerase specialized sigma24 family protein
MSLREKWSLTQESFDKFLACLDAERERAGVLYERIRGKLISYFECRDCPSPEDHADETINRVARKLASGEDIRDLSTYVYGVARLLMLEILKERSKKQSAIEHLSRYEPDSPDDDGELRILCFKDCLSRLAPDDRSLITRYYEGERRVKIENRINLAEELAISQTALRIRAFRLRSRLEACVGKCTDRAGKKE